MTSQLQPLEPTERHDIEFSNILNSNSNVADSMSSSPKASNPPFDAKVFWGVNAFILFLICLTGLWCCFVQKHFFNETERRLASDRSYQARRRRRLGRLEDARTESPEKRRQKLHASFHKHGVQMTVIEGDLIHENNNDDFVGDCSIKDTKCETNQTGIDADERDDCNHDHDDIEAGEQDGGSLSLHDEDTGHLKLRTGKLVPNCCAVCLSGYRVGDVVTWSSNPKCVHAFHRECVVDWLIKMQPETPCPCCRQEFTDLEDIRKERKIKWVGTNAFDFNAVRFW